MRRRRWSSARTASSACSSTSARAWTLLPPTHTRAPCCTTSLGYGPTSSLSGFTPSRTSCARRREAVPSSRCSAAVPPSCATSGAGSRCCSASPSPPRAPHSCSPAGLPPPAPGCCSSRHIQTSPTATTKSGSTPEHAYPVARALGGLDRPDAGYHGPGPPRRRTAGLERLDRGGAGGRGGLSGRPPRRRPPSRACARASAAGGPPRRPRRGLASTRRAHADGLTRRNIGTCALFRGLYIVATRLGGKGRDLVSQPRLQDGSERKFRGGRRRKQGLRRLAIREHALRLG